VTTSSTNKADRHDIAVMVEEVTDKQQYYRYIMTVSFICGGSSH
jgi:hypothetical protein